MFAHQIKIKRLKRLTKMYNDTGLIAKVHGNAGTVAKNVTSFSDSVCCKIFAQLRRTTCHNLARQK